MKAQLPDNEEERLNSLYSYNILDSLPEEVFDDLTFLASEICQTPISVISFVDQERQWFKSVVGMDLNEVKREVGFCAHAILNDKVMVVSDATADERFKDNPFVTDGNGIRYYAGAPLITETGEALGTICVIDTVPRELSEKQIKSLKALSRQVMSQLELRKNILKMGKIENTLKDNEQLLEMKIQKRTHELENEKSKLNNLFMNAPAFIALLYGPEHIYEFSNPMHRDLMSHRDMIGKPIREVLTEVADPKFFERLDNVYNTGKPFFGNEIPVNIMNKSTNKLGKHFLNFVYQPIFNENNSVIGISIFSFDVTELVDAKNKLKDLTDELIKSEAQYKELSESLEVKVIQRTKELLEANNEIEIQKNRLNSIFVNAPAMISVVYGPKHIYSYINPFYEKIIGNRNIIGKSVAEAFPEVENQQIFDILDNVYQSGKPFIGSEIPVLMDMKGDGKPQMFYFNFVYQPLVNSENEVEGISTFAFDVTDQVLAMRKVQEIANNLIKSNEQLQQFAYIASHDLQEPLRTVVSYTQLLERRTKEKLNDSEKEFMKLIIEATKRMQNLIEDLLNYSKVSLQEKDYKTTDLNKILDTVLDNLLSSTETNQAQILIEKLPTLRVIRAQMIQLFQNLISNAIKYRKKDIHPIIKISCQKREDDWLFSVTDNGIGINKDYFEKIFLIFQRLHFRNEYAGTGIGLATCKKIIEIHHGQIWLESKEGEGTTFFFTLPD